MTGAAASLFNDIRSINNVLRIVLIVLLVMQVSYVQPLLTENTDIDNSINSIYGLYVIRRYGNVTLLLLNRSALRYVDGFWTVVLRDIDSIDVAEEILRVVAGGEYNIQVIDLIVENGVPRILCVYSIYDEDKVLPKDVSKIISIYMNAGLKNARIRVHVLSKGSLWIRIESLGLAQLDIKDVAKAIANSVSGKRVVIQEVMSLGKVPSPFEARDLDKSLQSIPCLTSLSEGPYGFAIEFSYTCISEIAARNNTSFDKAMMETLSRLRDITPLLRKYVPHGEFLVMFSKVRPTIPLVAEPKEIKPNSKEPTKTSSKWNSTPVESNNVTHNQGGLKVWIIHDYGDLVIIKINRSLFRNLGDGYWLVVLPGMKYSEFDNIALNQVVPYLHIGSPEILLHVIWLGRSYVVKVNETRGLSKDVVKAQECINEFLENIGHRGLVPAEMKFFVESNNTYIIIGGTDKLNIDEFAKLAHKYFRDISKRVVVVEKFGWLLPGGPYQRMEMLDALGELPCFFSFGEAVYGTSIIFNATCIKELAERNNMVFNEAVEYIVGEVKNLDPLIRKYLPWHEILIMIAKTPKLIIPVGTTSTNTSKPPSEVQVETVQTEKQPQNTINTETYYEEYAIPHQLILITLIIIAVSIIAAVIIKYKVA